MQTYFGYRHLDYQQAFQIVQKVQNQQSPSIDLSSFNEQNLKENLGTGIEVFSGNLSDIKQNFKAALNRNYIQGLLSNKFHSQREPMAKKMLFYIHPDPNNKKKDKRQITKHINRVNQKNSKGMFQKFFQQIFFKPPFFKKHFEFLKRTVEEQIQYQLDEVKLLIPKKGYKQLSLHASKETAKKQAQQVKLKVGNRQEVSTYLIGDAGSDEVTIEHPLLKMKHLSFLKEGNKNEPRAVILVEA